MKNKFKLALDIKCLVDNGYDIYYEHDEDVLEVEKDGMIHSFKSEKKFQEWLTFEVERMNKIRSL